ncbi:PREDICTED: uncharacterized protein LOC104613059 isoform X2 [Nelumbo nucifera]|uniref:Tic22-like family protein n=2 Tax=Nelumbo nucifera TaxID=4432 RepID=A0A822ZUQ4_NELNU|nr:PREDICTED: uncharacterized protein LOC104613059 isoform X2 [Nelumbo nucifera]DAD47085.1 TPA_asm: hypothetical protein HUJ06_017022 [Nelumbo nucifera]
MASIHHENSSSRKENLTHSNTNKFTFFVQSASSNLFSLFTLNNKNKSYSATTMTTTTASASRCDDSSRPFSTSSAICVPFLFANSLPPPLPSPSIAAVCSSSPHSNESNSFSSASAMKGMSSGASRFPSTVRIAGLSSTPKRGGPAFVGQVFSMCDLSGTGLMAVSTRIEIPFLSQRTPEWMKKIFAMFTKSGKNGPVFRFFLDLGDAVAYVKRLNIPTGVVGACRLDLAYEHFKVKAANKLLKTIPQSNGRRKVHGVPVFTAQNLDIAIATNDGIKWYTPYFFDKNILDNILQESVDQHFHTLIQNRHVQRRQDVIDDNLASEIAEENAESPWEPPEVQEVLDEMGHPGIPLNVISKAAEMQLLHTVDKVLLGNRWLRKATGIQPQFPYMVDSFEERSAASVQRAAESACSISNSKGECVNDRHEWQPRNGLELKERDQAVQGQRTHTDFWFPFSDWFANPWSKNEQNPNKENKPKTRKEGSSKGCMKQEPKPLNPLLPKITMVGISTGEGGQMNRASLKKMMEDLTRELEQTGQRSGSTEPCNEDRDPLFVANVGDYYSSMAKTGSARWVRSGNS